MCCCRVQGLHGARGEAGIQGPPGTVSVSITNTQYSAQLQLHVSPNILANYNKDLTFWPITTTCKT